jgi:Glu-tRNA(Gln) amidotransferase subunit E-like FAD-binding protein
VRLFDRLFTVEQPDAEEDFLSVVNPESLTLAREARLEPALAEAQPGSRYQFLRQGYFFADPQDSRPGKPVFNRTITLKDTWAGRSAARPAGRPVRPRKETPVAEARTVRKGRAEARAGLHAADPALAERFARHRAELGLGEDEADRLAGDRLLSAFFEQALTAHNSPRTVSRWLLNELLGLARNTPLDALPLTGPAFGRFVALVDSGRVTPAAGKTLLASLVERGGEPEALLREMGLAKVEDRGAIDAAVARALAAQAAEVARYRAGEKKLFGVLLGAAMRETQGKADAAVVRKVLQEHLA